MTNYILLTIDVEDWFQVENFKQWIPFSTWSSLELRVEQNTHRLLDLFDTFVSTGNSQPLPRLSRRSGRSYWGEIHNSDSLSSEIPRDYLTGDEAKLTGASNPLRATFFILGWLAERLPHLVREIHARGHEVASHGYQHNILDKQSNHDLKNDLSNSKRLLEDIIGAQIWGYRAPNFSINNDALKIIEDCGYLYDSSYNSFDMHSRYGKISLYEKNRVGIAYRISSDFYELPISNLKFVIQNPKSKIQNLVLPWGGGGYFRLIPYPIFKQGVKAILKNEEAYLIYLHPWEVDPKQPRVQKASAGYKFRHYINLNKTHSKLSSLITDFSYTNFLTCRKYIEK